MASRLTQEEFIEKAKAIHGDKYDYSMVEYVNNRTKICIICPDHGEFWQAPDSHLQGHGCPKCRSDKMSKIEKYNNEIFINKARRVHGDKYNYSKVEYINSKTKVCIICPIHGEFWQLPSDHLRGIGCAACSKRKKLTTDEFIKKAIEIHGFTYDYSNVRYINNITEVEIICPEHGSFFQKPNYHINGNGCPICKSSRGERLIKSFLDYNEIEYKIHHQIKIDQRLFSRNNFRIDFYLPKYETFIEFNGVQHYKHTPYFHRDEDAFGRQVDRDKRLRQYCKQHKINLIEIKYDQIEKIGDIIYKKINELNKSKYVNACLEVAKGFVPSRKFSDFEKELNIKFREL